MTCHVFFSAGNSAIAPLTQGRETLSGVVCGNAEFLNDLAGIGAAAYQDMR